MSYKLKFTKIPIIKFTRYKNRKYLILYNGGHPFLVNIEDNNNVSVFKMPKKQYNDGPNYYNNKLNNKLINHPERYYTIFVDKYTPTKIFIGKSYKSPMTEFSMAYGPEYDGNTILLQIEPKKYIWIGGDYGGIYEIETYGEIVEYYSPVGNAHSPYPYAIDEYGNNYILRHKVVITGIPPGIDPYDIYYDELNKIKPGTRFPAKRSKDRKFWDIKEYYHDNKRYMLTYIPNSRLEDHYRIITSKGDKLYIVDSKNKKSLLEKKDYFNLMKDYADYIHIKSLKNKRIH